MVYQQVNTIFQKYESDINAAEAHGIATAMLCIDSRADITSWLAEAFAEQVDLSAEDKSTVVDLFNHTRLLLTPEETDKVFDLFLPAEDDLEEQVIALSDWCQGFLWGIGYAQNSSAQWSKEVHDILHDLVEFTKLDTDIEEDNEEDEEAFMQIHQYLRAAVLMIRDELNQHYSELIH
jgi:yecA family protein